MRLRYECGIWELFVPGIGPDTLYKFEIKGQSGDLLPLKADPHAFYAERPFAIAAVPPDVSTATVVLHKAP